MEISCFYNLKNEKNFSTCHLCLPPDGSHHLHHHHYSLHPQVLPAQQTENGHSHRWRWKSSHRDPLPRQPADFPPGRHLHPNTTSTPNHLTISFVSLFRLSSWSTWNRRNYRSLITCTNSRTAHLHYTTRIIYSIRNPRVNWIHSNFPSYYWTLSRCWKTYNHFRRGINICWRWNSQPHFFIPCTFCSSPNFIFSITR